MVSTLKVNKIQIPNSDSDVISLDATTGNIAFNKPVTGTAMVNYLEHTGGAHQGSYMCGSMIDGQQATVINGFRFQFHSGNIHGGYVKIYGIK